MNNLLLTQQYPLITCALDQYVLMEIKGNDAEKYLQGQLTCDVAKLAIGDSTLTAHCDPKGKMSGLFRLIRQGEQLFYVMTKQDLLSTTLAQLKKYAVFSQVTFQQLDWQLIGIAGEREKCGAISAQIDLALATPQPRWILCHPTPLNVTLNSCSHYWDVLDIQDGIPQLAPQTQLEFIPQAFNLQAIEQAISFQKGCYIGQETVARAKFRGANKRAMFTLFGKTDALPELNSEIEMQLDNHWRKTGCIISAVNFSGVLWLQVVMNNQLEPDAKFRLNDTELQCYPLPYDI